MDMLMTIHDALMADAYIAKQAGGRIKFYEYPQASSVADPIIIIDPLSPPLSADYASDKPMTDEYLYQIDIWTKDRQSRDELAKRVSKVMRKQLGFGYFAGAADEYDRETGIYRDARRYRGKAYTEEVEALI